MKFKQIQRRFKTMNESRSVENGRSGIEESLNYTTDSDYSMLQDEVTDPEVDGNCTARTEIDDSEDQISVEVGNKPGKTKDNSEDREEDITAGSNATSENNNKKDRGRRSSDQKLYPRLYQMGCRELLSGESAIAIGLGPVKAKRKVMLRVVCSELLELHERGVNATILLPEAFLAVNFNDIASKDRVLGILRRSFSNLDFAETTDEYEESDAESSAGSNEAVRDGHRVGWRADGHRDYGNLRVPKPDRLPMEGMGEALAKLAKIAAAMQEVENENVALKSMLGVYGMDSEQIAECLELVRAGADPKLAIFAVERTRLSHIA